MRASSFATAFAAGLASVASAATVTYDWTVDWVRANPDGQHERPVIGINGAWPCPTIEATLGDTVVVKIKNNLGNQTTGLHFHGINQVNSAFMDGASGVTQCPVIPGESLTYQFVTDAPGTYWYHSHTMGQYPDGLRGPLVIHDPNDPYKDKYDEEVILSVSDWHHDETLTLVRDMLTTTNTQFRPPLPKSILMNEGGLKNYQFERGKTYRFRIINFGAFASAMIQFDSHTMQVIMNDAAYVAQHQAYQLRVSPSQRFDVLIAGIDRDNRNYPILASLDANRDWTVSSPAPAYNLNATGYLVMDTAKPFPSYSVKKWDPVDDAHFRPYDNADQLPAPDRVIQLDFSFCRDVNNLPRACFNNQTYIPQRVPTLMTAATVGEHNTDPSVYGHVLPFIVNYGEVVDIVVNNIDAAVHPFHLHGHHFQVLERPRSGTGSWTGRTHGFNPKPPQRDVVHVMANSFAVLRFKATNPGVFLFHCHIEWHVEMGLTATIIEAPDRLRNLVFPADHLNACQKLNTPTSGNAAGNTVNPLDTSGYFSVPDQVYNGAMYTPLPAPPKRRNINVNL